jgi:SAM-dependent methyltransferase
MSTPAVSARHDTGMTTVRDYYEANTRKFLLFGAQGAIHRELWAPGITSRAAALHHVHELVLTELRGVSPAGRGRVLDLGCGVGAAVRFLAERVPARIYGISVSPAQVAIARRRMAGRRLHGECSFHEGDFCAMPAALASEARHIDLAFSIEAFVHAESTDRFFREASRALRPGGRLVIVDDFLAKGGAESALIDDVTSGWHMQSLVRRSEAVDAAALHGLRLTGFIDLSSLQRLGRPRDRLVHALQPLFRRIRRHSPWAQSLVGGDALQRCHRLGLINYQLLRFDKV